MTTETKELGETTIEVNMTITVECSGQNSDDEWEQYEYEVAPGSYEVYEAELVEGVLYCLCDEIMRGDTIIFQPFDFELTPA